MCDDYPAIQGEVTRIARKDHKCIECKQIIPKGSQYLAKSSLYDGHWFNWKECLTCVEFISKVLAANLDEYDNCYEIGRFYNDYVLYEWDNPKMPRDLAPEWFKIKAEKFTLKRREMFNTLWK